MLFATVLTMATVALVSLNIVGMVVARNVRVTIHNEEVEDEIVRCSCANYNNVTTATTTPATKSSSDESIDSDDETAVQTRKKREENRLRRRRPIRIPFPFTDKTSTRSRSDGGGGEREKNLTGNGLFIIDSTGQGGNVGIKVSGNLEKQSTHTQLDPGVDLTKNLPIDFTFLKRNNNRSEVDELNKDFDMSKEADLITKLMKKATFKPSMEKNPTIPRVSKGQLKRDRKAQSEKTKGADWFDMPATELTDERRQDLEIMQLRDVLDPKRRYRSDDRAVLPKYFQIGTVIEHPADFYHSRIPRKERKQTIVDELLADADFQKRSKRKYAEITQDKGRRERRSVTDNDDQKKRDKIKKKRKLKS